MSNVQCSGCDLVFTLDESVCPRCGCRTFSRSNAASTVWVLGKGKYNVGSAREFGEVQFIFEEKDEIDSFDLQFFVATLKERIRSFNGDTDFVAMTGPSTLLAIFMAVMFVSYKEMNILVFDPVTTRYKGKWIKL